LEPPRQLVGLSVGKQGSGPKAQVEGIEPRNPSWEGRRCCLSGRLHRHSRYGKTVATSPGSETLARYTLLGHGNSGDPNHSSPLWWSMADKR